MVALATSSLDKNNFIHLPPGLMILKMYLSIVVVVPIHLDGESWLATAHQNDRLKWAGQLLSNLGPFHRSVVFALSNVFWLAVETNRSDFL